MLAHRAVRACVALRARHGYGRHPPTGVVVILCHGAAERRFGEERREHAKVFLAQGHGDEREEARARLRSCRARIGERAEEVRGAFGEGDVVWVRGYPVMVECQDL